MLVQMVKGTETLQNVIIEGRSAFKVLCTATTVIVFFIGICDCLKMLFNNLTVMTTSTVNQAVSLGNGLECAARAFEHIVLLFCVIGMASFHVVDKIDLLWKSTFAYGAHIRKVVCMLLHMVMHR